MQGKEKREKIINSSVKTVIRPKRHSSGNESIYQLQYAKNREGKGGKTKVHKL